MNRLLTGIAVVILLCGFLFWWFHPQQALKRRTKGLMNTLTLVDGAGAASRNLKLGPLSRAITDDVEISGAGDRRAEGTFRRESIEAGFAWLSRNARSTSFQIRRFESISISGDTGVVTATVDAMVILPRETPLDGEYSMTLTWRNNSESWQLTGAKWQPR